MSQKTKKIITALSLIILSTSLTACSSGAPNKSSTQKSEQSKVEEKTPAFNFVANKNQPETVQDFLPIFAQQLKKYNEVAEKIWPDSAVTQIPVVLDDTDSKKMWKITPDGQVSDFSDKEAEELNVERSESPGTWGFYGKQFEKHGLGINFVPEGVTLEGGGMYFSLNEAALKDKEIWNRYPHLGSYDALVFVLHENFHIFEQEKWDKLSDDQIMKLGAEKDQHLDKVEARVIRYQLVRELMAAVAQPKDQALLLQALSTYQEYKTKHKADYVAAQYWDRTEGSAQYMEVMTALHTYFPDQLKTDKDITQAIQIFGKQTKGYGTSSGSVEEAYDIGAMAGILLDRYDTSWKTKLMKDKNSTPMSLLAEHFQNDKLPDYTPLNEGDRNKLLEQIATKKKELVTYQKESLEQMKKELQSIEDPQQKTELEKAIKSLEEKIAALEK